MGLVQYSKLPQDFCSTLRLALHSESPENDGFYPEQFILRMKDRDFCEVTVKWDFQKLLWNGSFSGPLPLESAAPDLASLLTRRPSREKEGMGRGHDLVKGFAVSLKHSHEQTRGGPADQRLALNI